MKNSAQVFWITGLSGAGKSTLGRAVASVLRGQGEPVILLDGDEMREVFGANGAVGKDYGRDARIALAKRYSLLSNVLSSQGFTVVVATISLFREVHQWNRKNLPNYFEVYLKVPVEELRHRDPKGIYQRFDNGEITDVAGLDLEIDEPENPDWSVDFKPDRTASSLAHEVIGRARIGKKT